MKRKHPLNPGEHEALGVVLVRMRDELLAVHAACRRAYPKGGRVKPEGWL